MIADCSMENHTKIPEAPTEGVKEIVVHVWTATGIVPIIDAYEGSDIEA